MQKYHAISCAYGRLPKMSSWLDPPVLVPCGLWLSERQIVRRGSFVKVTSLWVISKGFYRPKFSLFLSKLSSLLVDSIQLGNSCQFSLEWGRLVADEIEPERSKRGEASLIRRHEEWAWLLFGSFLFGQEQLVYYWDEKRSNNANCWDLTYHFDFQLFSHQPHQIPNTDHNMAMDVLPIQLKFLEDPRSFSFHRKAKHVILILCLDPTNAESREQTLSIERHLNTLAFNGKASTNTFYCSFALLWRRSWTTTTVSVRTSRG